MTHAIATAMTLARDATPVKHLSEVTIAGPNAGMNTLVMSTTALLPDLAR